MQSCHILTLDLVGRPRPCHFCFYVYVMPWESTWVYLMHTLRTSSPSRVSSLKFLNKMVDRESGIMSGSLEQGEDMELEVDHAGSSNYAGSASVIGQCTDSGDVSSAVMVSGRKRKYDQLALYDSSLIKRRTISNRLESHFNTLHSYKMAEPIGCAILLSSDRTADPTQISSLLCRQICRPCTTH